MAATAAMSPASFLAWKLTVAPPGVLERSAVNLALLTLCACIAVLANAIGTLLFSREVDERLSTEMANRELREIDRAKSDFIANVSHDLRSPLTAVLGPINSLVNDTRFAPRSGSTR
jgi:signal transduction histidine kinase